MALTICPDCGREVSTQATLCLHCGCPLGKDEEGIGCALILLAADPNDPRMTQRLQDVTGLSPAETDSLRSHVPAVLKRGLPYGDCVALSATFTAQTQLGILPDRDAEDPRRLAKVSPLQREPFQPPKPVGFWTIVGAIVSGLAIWACINLVLGGIFFM